MKKKKEKKEPFKKDGFIRRFKDVTFKFCFVMVYIIHKILVLLKNQLNYLKNSTFEDLKDYNRLF